MCHENVAMLSERLKPGLNMNSKYSNIGDAGEGFSWKQVLALDMSRFTLLSEEVDVVLYWNVEG